MAKTSKRTEEEMLQETFAQFQAQATTEDAATESGDTSPGAVKNGNKNNLILLASCVAAVGIVGYIFFVKPMLSSEQVAAPTQNNQTQLAANQNNQAQQPVAPVNPTQQNQGLQAPVTPEPQVQQPALDPIAQLQAQANQVVPPMPAATPVAPPDAIKTPEIDKFFAQGQQMPAPVPAPVNPAVPAAPIQAPIEMSPTPSTPTPSVQTQVAVTPGVVTEPVAPIVPNNPVVADINPVAPVVPVTALDAQQTNVVTELQNRFEAQNNEFKNLIAGVDGRVTGLEEKVTSHDARITRLESFHEGQKAKVKPAEKKVESVSSSSEVKSVAASEKAKAVVKKVRPEVKPRNEVVQDENVLFGSNSGAKRKESPKKAEKPSYQEYPIHSIYGGRFWVKNSDGSLSTYAAGDKLPSGEVIKEVNDEEFSIKTNLRTIVKR